MLEGARSSKPWEYRYFYMRPRANSQRLLAVGLCTEELWEAQRIIEKHGRQDPSPEEARILGLVRHALEFISTTGQRYRFRDYRQQEPSFSPQDGAESGGALRQAEDFFRKRLEAPHAPEERELLRVVIDALQFIASTGQLASLEDYIQHLEEGAPPYVVAAFGSMAEAEAWLMNHAAPPDFAHIIVAGEYRSVFHDRQTTELREAEPPVPVASFDTREDAETWLLARSEPARRVWISIGGDLYLAADYPQISHRALFPLSLAENQRVE